MAIRGIRVHDARIKFRCFITSSQPVSWLRKQMKVSIRVRCYFDFVGTHWQCVHPATSNKRLKKKTNKQSAELLTEQTGYKRRTHVSKQRAIVIHNRKRAYPGLAHMDCTSRVRERSRDQYVQSNSSSHCQYVVISVVDVYAGGIRRKRLSGFAESSLLPLVSGVAFSTTDIYWVLRRIRRLDGTFLFRRNFAVLSPHRFSGKWVSEKWVVEITVGFERIKPETFALPVTLGFTVQNFVFLCAWIPKKPFFIYRVQNFCRKTQKDLLQTNGLF